MKDERGRIVGDGKGNMRSALAFLDSRELGKY
jgi:hypothetical protein